MEAQAYKEQEEALLIQTHALKIDNKEELSQNSTKISQIEYQNISY